MSHYFAQTPKTDVFFPRDCEPLVIAEYVQRFATKEAADATAEKEVEGEDEEMSDIGSISEDEEQPTDD